MAEPTVAVQQIKPEIQNLGSNFTASNAMRRPLKPHAQLQSELDELLVELPETDLSEDVKQVL